MLRARVLGSAAGGGFPQWNCACLNCRAVRDGSRPARPRMQSSIAVAADDGDWFLVNASPDVRQQLELLAADCVDEPDVARRSPFAGVLLTDAEIDHTLGLLVLRESGAALSVRAGAFVRDTLTRDLPLLGVLEHFSGVQWEDLEPGARVSLDGSLMVEAFPAGGDPPRYARPPAHGPAAVGLTFSDGRGSIALTYVPGVAELNEDLVARLTASDCVLVDGTCWSDDEVITLRGGTRTARDMGHVPLSGPGGSLRVLAGLARPRVILIHINNSNPILLEDSPQRAELDALGVEVAHDGMEIVL